MCSDKNITLEPELRERAEKRLKETIGIAADLSDVSHDKLATLIHELQVHQIELKMQNHELRRTQEELENARDKYSNLYNFSPVGYVTLTEKGIIDGANLTCASMLGVERRALIGSRFTSFIFKEDQDIFYTTRLNLLASDNSQSCDLRLITKNGNAFFARLDCIIRNDKENDSMQIRATISDITIQKRAEDILQRKTNELRERIKELNCIYSISDLRETPGISLEEIYMGVVEILVESWRFPEITCARITISDKAYQTDNFQKSEWKQKSDIRVNQQNVGSIEVYYLEQKPESDEGPFLKEERKLLDAVAHRVGRIIRYMQVMKELQNANEVLEDKVQTRTKELKKRTEQLGQLTLQLTLSEERERQRIADILHDDLQQLLVAVKMNLENMFTHIRPSRQQDIKRVHEMVLESIQKSRILTSELSPPLLKQRGLVPALTWLASYIQKTHGLRVDLQLDPRVDVSLDDYKILLFQCVRELLLNVIKHARVSSTILSMAIDESNTICISVIDKGDGFDPNIIDADNDGGYGLLSIRERLSLLGGCLEVDSHFGKGTTCTLIVPLIDDKLSCEEEKDTLPECKSRPFKKGDVISILLVDDHSVMREGLSSLLKNQPDLKIVGEAANGEEAIALSRELRPDVILMDYSMPRMGGVEATKKIISEFPATRIIGLSMYDEPEIKSIMLAAGAEANIAKDGSSEELLSAIRGQDNAG